MYSPSLKKISQDLLTEGRNKLGLSMGIVSHIYGDEYEIVAVSSATGVFVAGEVFRLKDTYCRDVFDKKIMLALNELEGEVGLCRHPLYDTLPLEAYISAPIFDKNNGVWGTINFSCMRKRTQAFTEDEKAFVNHAADLLSAEIITNIETN